MALLIATLSCSSPDKQEQGDEGPMGTMIMLSKKDQLLANIKTEEAVIKVLAEMTTRVGKAALDERKVELLTSRASGRLDELFVRSPGEYVHKGQAVYAMYSEALLADENDYLLALEQYETAITQKNMAAEMLAAAKKRLSRWTLTENQILELGRTKRTSPLITFYCPYSGYTIELLVREGEYVSIGTPLLKLSELNTLWVETQVYTNEVYDLYQSPSVQIAFEPFPDEMVTGELAFDNPLLEQDEKVNLVRFTVPNEGRRIKPGMMAYVYWRRNGKRTLVVPKSALLVESHLSVWVEVDEGMFEQRMITTGRENKVEVEVLSGLQPGDKVVVSGAFLLKSESLIRQGGGDMGGMKM